MSPMVYQIMFYSRLRLIRSVLRISQFSVHKLIEIVILWVYYTIPYGFSLFWYFLGILFQIFLIHCLVKDQQWRFKYTNGKKKQCIAKMLITHKICSGWAWTFINMVSPIHTFNYQTFTRFHVLLVRHLFFLWKLHFMSSATEKQHATKLIDAKRKFMERMIRKPLYFC